MTKIGDFIELREGEGDSKEGEGISQDGYHTRVDSKVASDSKDRLSSNLHNGELLAEADGWSLSSAVSVRDADPESWREAGEWLKWQLFMALFSLFMYLVDVGTDVKVAVDHFTAEDYVWGALTLLLALAPTVIVQILSLWWLKEDDKIPIVAWICHSLGMGPVYRCCVIISYMKQVREDPEIDDYKRLVSSKLDFAFLAQLQAYMEDAPQLVLQLYVKTTLRQYDIELTRARDVWLVISLVFSVVSLSFALLNYYWKLRNSVRAKIRKAALAIIFFWRLFGVTSRVITLALFASLYKVWFFVLFVLHSTVMFLFLWRQQMSYFEDSICKQRILKLLFAFVLFFSYTSIEGKNTQNWSVIFHIINGIEIISLIVLWYYQQSHFSDHFSMAVLTYVIIAFFLSIFFMSLFYAWCHPTHRLKVKVEYVLRSSANEQPSEKTDVPTPIRASWFESVV